MIGASPEAARVAGISTARNIVVIMLVAGALAGLAGMVEVSMSFGRLRQGISPGYGYMAILIAALAGGSLFGHRRGRLSLRRLRRRQFWPPGARGPAVVRAPPAGPDPLLRPCGLDARGCATHALDPGPLPRAAPARGAREGGAVHTLTTLLTAAVAAGTPLLFAALGEVVAERAGVINLGIEGMMLVGAVTGFLAMNETGSLVTGVAAALAAGAAVATVHAFFSVTLRANQIISGLGITIAGTGLAALLGRSVIGVPARASFDEEKLPLLGSHPGSRRDPLRPARPRLRRLRAWPRSCGGPSAIRDSGSICGRPARTRQRPTRWACR